MPLRDTTITAAIFVAAAVVYALGASSTIYVGDSGELVAAVHTLGVPHPSGYPLYVFAGKLWTLLFPFGSIASRMSYFSVVTAAAAVAVLFRVGRALRLGPTAAAVAALSLAFAPSFWSQANVQRVYSLNALMMAASLVAALAWHRSGHRRKAWLTFLLAGLGASNHLYMGLQGMVLAVHGWWTRRESRSDWRLWLGSAVAFAVGLVPYLLLAVRSRADPRLDWGNPETIPALVAHALRRSHWSRAWWSGWEDLGPILGDFAAGVGREFLWLGVPLIVLGLVYAVRERLPLGLLLALPAVNLAAMAAHGSHADLFIWHRYYIPSYLCAALLAGAGVEWVGRSRGGRWAAAALVLPAALLVTGWRQHDRSDYRIAEAFSLELLSELPPGSHLAASDDNILFVLIYLDLVEGVRPDVHVILQGVGAADLPPLRFEPGTEDLFFTHHPNWSLDAIELVPRGLAFQVVRRGSGVAPRAAVSEWLPGERDPAVPKDYLTQNLIGQFHYMRGLANEVTDWSAAVVEFERAAAAAPDNDVLFYNLGLILRRNERLPLAREAFARAHRINPRGILSNREALASDRLREVERAIGAGNIAQVGHTEGERALGNELTRDMK